MTHMEHGDFDGFAKRMIEGGAVSDADVNEWVAEARPDPWYLRLLDWLLEVFDDRG